MSETEIGASSYHEGRTVRIVWAAESRPLAEGPGKTPRLKPARRIQAAYQVSRAHEMKPDAGAPKLGQSGTEQPGPTQWSVPGGRCPVVGARCPVTGDRCPVPGAR